jgi:hypothetical protein
LLLGAGFFLVIAGIVADLISVNRKLLEKIDLRLRRLELDGRASIPPRSVPSELLSHKRTESVRSQQ